MTWQAKKHQGGVCSTCMGWGVLRSVQYPAPNPQALPALTLHVTQLKQALRASGFKAPMRWTKQTAGSRSSRRPARRELSSCCV